MSVIMIIKEMEMPDRCANCDYWRSCKVIDKYDFLESARKVCAERPMDCPLVEIPTPHGRLIDGDTLIAAYDAQHEGEPGRARKLMEDAPTIIEAEGEE